MCHNYCTVSFESGQMWHIVNVVSFESGQMWCIVNVSFPCETESLEKCSLVGREEGERETLDAVPHDNLHLWRKKTIVSVVSVADMPSQFILHI